MCGFEVPTVVTMKDTNVCSVTPCILVEIVEMVEIVLEMVLRNNVSPCLLVTYLAYP
jgi:hypothetical protein